MANKKVEIKTSSWIPKIVKVENGYIVNLESPTSDIIETHIFEVFQDVIDFTASHFEIVTKEQNNNSK